MSFSTSLSGLNAAARSLEVISNNIANADTTGFKQSSAQFADLYASSMVNTSSSMIGQGTQMQSVNQQFSQGSFKITENPLDLAINGEGFFQLDTGSSIVYSRAGNFSLDAGGHVVSPEGYRLMVSQADANGQVSGQVGPLQINDSELAPDATDEVVASVNLDAGAEPPAQAWSGPYNAFASPPTSPSALEFNFTNSTTVYDSLGNNHTASVYYVKTANPNEWETHTLIDGVETGGTTTLTFEDNGEFDPASLPVEININNWTPLTSFGASNGAATQNMTIDLSQSTQYGSTFSVNAISQDGRPTGQLSSVDISNDGTVFANYSSGESRSLGQIVLADFRNPQGLNSIGNNVWVETFASGQPVVNAPGTSGTGTLTSGALEKSNVDTADQLIQMIEVQQNYQANAQAIQTQDTLIQTIMNIR